MRRSLTAAAAIFLSYTPFAQAEGPTSNEFRALPNVLLIIADDMGVDKVSAYADDASSTYRDEAEFLPDTPVLDELSEVGVRFTDAWANPVCSPTRAALYTGLHGFRTGMGRPYSADNLVSLDPEYTSIADALAEEGYTTGLFGKWHLGENEPPAFFEEADTWTDFVGMRIAYQHHSQSHGWETFSGNPTGTLDDLPSYTEWTRLTADTCLHCDITEVTKITDHSEYITHQTVDDALDWIDEQTSPWLATVALHAPHSPFELPPEGCNYRPDDGAEPTTDKGIYEEMVECLDIGVGELLAGIDDLDDTLIVFIGDNGTVDTVAEAPYDDGAGKGSLRESGVRVPLIVADGKRWLAQQDGFERTSDWSHSPAFVDEPGTVLSEPVHAVDLFATLAQVAGADASSGTDSISFVPLLTGRDGDIRESIYSETFYSDGTGDLSLRRGEWKITVTVSNGEHDTCRSRVKLYNLKIDRFEATDLSDLETEVLQELLQELEALGETAQENPWFMVDDC